MGQPARFVPPRRPTHGVLCCHLHRPLPRGRKANMMLAHRGSIFLTLPLNLQVSSLLQFGRFLSTTACLSTELQATSLAHFWEIRDL